MGYESWGLAAVSGAVLLGRRVSGPTLSWLAGPRHSEIPEDVLCGPTELCGG